MTSDQPATGGTDYDIPVRPENEGIELDVDISDFEETIATLRRQSREERIETVDGILEDLPAPDEFEFVLILTQMIEKNLNDQRVLEDILDRFKTLLEEPSPHIDRDGTFVKFAAFHGLTIHSYLTETITEWGERHSRYGDEFRGWEYETMYRFDWAMQQYFTNETSKVRAARKELETLATGELSDNPGVINAYVECTLLAWDKKSLSVSDRSLRQAAEMIRHAIEMYAWPEYYRNWGRLLGIYGEREKEPAIIEFGIDRIKDGMDKEDASNMQKLSEYRQYLNNTQNRRRNVLSQIRLDDVEDELSKIEDRAQDIAQDIRSDTLQFLGFFAAIITFIITGVQFSTGLNTVSEIAAIIPVMTGSLVLSFSVFIFLLKDPINNRRPRFSLLAMWGVGTVLIGLGLGIIKFV
jgi:hypothetical protein